MSDRLPFPAFEVSCLQCCRRRGEYATHPFHSWLHLQNACLQLAHTAHTSLYDLACALTASGSERNYVAANLPQWVFDNIPFPSPDDSGVDIKHEFV